MESLHSAYSLTDNPIILFDVINVLSPIDLHRFQFRSHLSRRLRVDRLYQAIRIVSWLSDLRYVKLLYTNVRLAFPSFRLSGVDLAWRPKIEIQFDDSFLCK